MKICQRCVLPETFPSIKFDEHGVCHYCLEYPGADHAESNRQQLKNQMDDIIRLNAGKFNYDCVVAYSGGKDSTYILMTLVRQYQLRCLAITVDNGFISDRARENCHIATSALSVDHQFFKPSTSFMNNMYLKSAMNTDVHAKAAIKRASAMCNSCINLINNYMLTVALQNNVTLIAGGYISGQVPKDSAAITLDLNNHAKMRDVSMQRYIANFGHDATKYFGFSAGDSMDGKKIHIINPMLSDPLSEEQIIDAITQIGWVITKDTGRNSSNCTLNDLGIAVHYKKHRFNPYVFEISEQVRQGLLNREMALDKVQYIPEFAELTNQIRTIGLDIKEI